MRREILFKAKRTDTKEWIEGNYITDEQNPSKAYIGYLFGVNDDGTVHDTDIAEVDPETVCQYTGLTDKNGRKIFEGDIVSVSHSRLKEGEDERDFMPEYEEYTRNYAVEFVNKGSHCGYRCRNKSIHFALTSNTVYNHNIKVIGNLWDNPELLNQ